MINKVRSFLLKLICDYFGNIFTNRSSLKQYIWSSLAANQLNCF